MASAYVDENFKGGIIAGVRGELGTLKGPTTRSACFFDWSEGSTRPFGSLRRISSTLLRRALRPASPHFFKIHKNTFFLAHQGALRLSLYYILLLVVRDHVQPPGRSTTGEALHSHS